MKSFVFGGNTGVTPEELKRRRSYNEALIAAGSSTDPAKGGIAEGIARVLTAGLGGYFDRRDADVEKSERAKATSEYQKGITDMLSGGSALAYSPAGAAADGRYTAADVGAPAAPLSTKPGDENIYSDFIGGVKGGGLTNPYGLAAVAATGKAESGYSAGNAYRQWSDPSESGQAGMAGGIMSWRAGRLQAMRDFAARNGDDPNRPSAKTQAAFFLAEDPGLVQRLNSAKSVEEAQSLMNNAWAFAGHDRPGGEAARRLSTAQSYLPSFMGGPEASAAPAPAGQPVQVASLDPSIGMNSALAYDPRRTAEAPTPQQQTAALSPMPPPTTVAANPVPPQATAQDMVAQAFAGLSPRVQAAAQGDASFDGFAQSGQNVQGAPAAPAAPSQDGVSGDLAAMLAPRIGASASPQPAAGGNAASLINLLSNPWLTDGQQAVVGKLAERQLAQNAPLTPAERLAQERFTYEKEKDARSLKSWSKLDDDTLYNPVTGETKDLTGPTGAVPKDLGLNPQYGVDANGNPVLLQLGKDGKVVQSTMPNGVTLSKEPIKLDAGTHFVLLDPITRQPIGQIEKDVAGEERAKALGKAGGEKEVTAPADVQSAQNALDLIANIRSDPYRERGTGWSSYGNVVPGTGGYDFQRKVDQAKSGAFLTAIQQMRGLGSLSEGEGKAATAALNRMDTASSEEGFAAALDDYEKIVRQALSRAQQNLRSAPGASPAPAAGSSAPASAPAPGSYRYNPATGKMEPM